MGKVTPITEQFQHFVRDLKETFWGDLYGKARRTWQQFGEEESRRARDRYVVTEGYERAAAKRRSDRNGFYVRDFVTRLGTLRVRVARARDRSFRPPGGEPGGVGRFSEPSLRAWPGGEELAADRHRWVRGLGGGAADRFAASAASTLLGA